MANGRLNSVLIPPYASAEIYNNSSGSQASISIHTQTISTTDNSFVSIAATTTNYSSTVNTICTLTTNSINLCSCFKYAAYCTTNATEDYAGYYIQESGTCCYSPSFVTTGNTVIAKSYTPCFCSTCNNCWFTNPFNFICSCPYIINGGVVTTAVNPEIIVSRRGSAGFVVAEASCSCGTLTPCSAGNVSTLRMYRCSTLSTIQSRACHFADVCAGGVCAVADACCVFGTTFGIDMYSDQQIAFGGFGFTCYPSSCCCCRCAFYSACGTTVSTLACGQPGFPAWPELPLCTINATTTCGASTANIPTAPAYLTGCELIVTSINYNYAYFRAYCSSCPAACNVALFSNNNCIPGVCCTGFRACYVSCVTWTPTGFYFTPWRWMGYNPSDCFNYFMYYSGASSVEDGIYRVTGMNILRCFFYTASISSVGSTCCQEPLCASTVFTKVSPVPTVFSCIGATNFCPSRLFHVETSRWILGVYNGGWQNYTTCDLINWCRLCDTVCYRQFTPNSNVFFTNGCGICKNCNLYFSCVNCAGTLEYCTSSNQLVKTGVVLSNGDRLYMNNWGPSPTSVNIWGYEG